MGDIKKSLGARLKEIRYVFLEGDKVSGRQFANALGESQDNIANYENGRANIPNRLLIRLYERGFSPIYILSGEGSMFAENETGKLLRNKIRAKRSVGAQVGNIRQFDYAKLTIEELEKKATQYEAAAGDIFKIIELKKRESDDYEDDN